MPNGYVNKPCMIEGGALEKEKGSALDTGQIEQVILEEYFARNGR